MSRASTQKSPGMLALDLALLLLGMLVLLLVVRLLRFDELNPLYNAWTYLLGVPSMMIAISMLTRVLTSEAVEKSIQLGFLISVGLHLLLVLFAWNLVLFGKDSLTNTQNVAIVTASNTTKSPQYFQPSDARSESRPDYLKPVKTEQNAAQAQSDPDQRPDESAKLDLDVAKDVINPKIAEKRFDKQRNEPSASQPTISSTAERLDRPDLSKPIEKPQSLIDIPKLQTSQDMLSQELQASSADTSRTESDPRKSNSIEAAIVTNLNIESRANLGFERGMQNHNSKPDAPRTNKELDKALAKTAGDLPERQSPLKRGTREASEFDPSMRSTIPIPRLGTPSADSSQDKPPERDTSVQTRSNDANARSRQSVGIADPQITPPLESRVSRLVGPSTSMRKSQNGENTIPSASSFLSDPRFAANGPPGGARPSRDIGDSPSAPAANHVIAIENVVPGNSAMDTSSIGALSEALSPKSQSGRSEIGKSRPTDSTKSVDTGREFSLSPMVEGPTLELGRELWAAPFLETPRKGLDPIKRDTAMPEIRDTDITIDRFKRPETGGPKIANSAVPIPAPAFSQRLKRKRDPDEQGSTELGPLGPQTEAAIERGLQFLAKYQRPDGSWHLEDFGERVDIRSETAATALSLLAFQGAGYTHRQFKYESVCGNALKWMNANQRPNGDLYVRTDAKSDNNAWLYSHAIATLALCESYGMTQDESIKDNAQRAIDFLVQSQDPQAGGWRYQPRIGSDTSVTGWCMMALKSAELAGLDVPKKSYDGISKWLKGSQASETQKFLYRYNWQAADTVATRHGRVPTPVMTSVGLLMRLYLGWRRENSDMIQGTDWLLERLPAEGTATNPQRDTYYWYYATQVLFHMGGERWKTWYGSLYPLLIRSQQMDGEFAGSWEPNGRIPDAWGRFGGRLYVTTLNLLSLEVYYRHLPIYEATAD